MTALSDIIAMLSPDPRTAKAAHTHDLSNPEYAAAYARLVAELWPTQPVSQENEE